MIRQIVLGLLLTLCIAGCDTGDDLTQGIGEVRSLTIYSTTDREAFLPAIADFRELHPEVEVSYIQMKTAELDTRFRQEIAFGRPRADLLLSSAMDLQVQLVNDGFAVPHRSANTVLLPNWARWRDEALGFTFEPVVMVFNREMMNGRKIPASRPELLASLRADPGFWRGRIGTYDIARSSVGYLIASQDARQSSDFGALVEAFREAEVFTSITTSEILHRIEAGELAMGYNVLGSYARAEIDLHPELQIVYPSDYTLAVSRTAVIPKSAPNAQAAHLFLEYLLSVRGQLVLTNRSRLNAIRPEIDGPYSRMGIAETSVGPIRPIALGPGLLVYLDRQKSARLLELWGGQAR